VNPVGTGQGVQSFTERGGGCDGIAAIESAAEGEPAALVVWWVISNWHDLAHPSGVVLMSIPDPNRTKRDEQNRFESCGRRVADDRRN
jgi:hypothetical protein